ncbi:uncharacterized protein LOC9306617 isoform X2 [Arabidopsis lyrata subsp. lyrata]|uniref:uncharacterized protein LOC9306617 isoform X2 n=1 Tax=Arabidopsis lyrata subsp. lyrata TaxID=81972 RepID=UPI000A29DF09|nr:uncharacterized protein LOC9306617 isoform X2 [Arabidopsis lyrata subsp. lyrata]|eukprot:XP_020875601.1 uncharacterized protein LOC9306617 isoform X2 [Arabidopsis lyrata subsp. lyrata]
MARFLSDLFGYGRFGEVPQWFSGSGSNREASPIWFYGGLEGVDGWSVEQSKSWRWAIGQRFPQGNGLWFSNLLVFEMIYHPFLMIDLFQRSLVSYKVSYSHNFVGRERNISVEISDQKGKNQRFCCKVFILGYYVKFNSRIIYVCVIEVMIKGMNCFISGSYGVLVMEIMEKYYWLYAISELWYLVGKKGLAINVCFTSRSIANQVNEGQNLIYHDMVKGFTDGRNPPILKVDK